MSGTPGLGLSNLGERVSILFSIEGDPEHPFSEVVGVLMRVTDAEGPEACYSIVRRSGEVVEVRRDAVLSLKLMAPASGPIRRPSSWDVGEEG